MPANVEILIGPAKVGKTANLLQRLRSHVLQNQQAGKISNVLWIAPNNLAVESIQEKILSSDLKSALGISIATFEQVARRVVANAQREIHPLTRTQQRRMVREIILRRLESDNLTTFAEIAETDGFLDLVLELIQDMKHREIWPEELLSLLEKKRLAKRAKSPEDALIAQTESAQLYEEYQSLLNTHKLYDSEGQFWVARSLLTEGEPHPFETTKVIIADGFSDFTRTQHEILEQLAKSAEVVAISLLCDIAATKKDAPPARLDLFSKTRATLNELKKRHPQSKVRSINSQSSDSKKIDWPAFNYIEKNLFRPPYQVDESTVPSADAFSTLRVVIGQSEAGEVEQIASDIKRKLADGKNKPTEILVVSRTLPEQADLVETIFAEFGIPFFMETHQPISQSAFYKTLLSLLRLDQEDWPFRPLLSVITNREIRPTLAEGSLSDTLPDALEVARIAAERFVRSFQIDKGCGKLLDRIEKAVPKQIDAEEDDTPEDSSTQKHRAAVQNAMAFLQGISAALDALPKKASPREWCIAIQALMGQLGFGQQDKSSDATALPPEEIIFKSLQSLEPFATTCRQETPQLNRPDLIEAIQDIAHYETLPNKQQNIGCVRVLSAASARGVEADHLYFIGLTEKAFPSDRSDYQLFSETDFAKLQSGNQSPSPIISPHEEEMLLFYEVLARAKQSITFSYPGLDERAAPLMPSPFLQELIRLCNGQIPTTDATMLQVVDPIADPVSPAQFRRRAVADAIGLLSERNEKRLAQVLSSAEETPSLSSLEAGLRIIAERASGETLGPAEGVMFGKQSIASVAKNFNEAHLWSTSQLEQYAYCPFQFYLNRTLKLKPLDDLALNVDYLQRGRIVHDMLLQFHGRIREIGESLATTDQLGEREFAEQLKQILDSIAEATPLWGVDEALREIDLRQATEWSLLYHEQHSNYDKTFTAVESPFTPAHFEVRFGPVTHGEEESPDSLTQDSPYELNVGDGFIRITGRIDRIDIGVISGKRVFNIIDYKTSGVRQILDDRPLQLEAIGAFPK